MKRLASREPACLRRWVVESCRAELCHWLAMLPGLLFILWTPPVAALLNLLYGVLINLPCVIAQRYNRPRLLVLLGRSGRVAPLPQSGGRCEAPVSLSQPSHRPGIPH